MINQIHPKYGQPVCCLLASVVYALMAFDHIYLAMITLLILLVIGHLTLKGTEYAASNRTPHHQERVHSVWTYVTTKHQDRSLRIFKWSQPAIIVSFILVGIRFLLVALGIIQPNHLCGIMCSVWLVIAPIVFCVLALSAKRALEREARQVTLAEFDDHAAALAHRAYGE